MDRTLGSGVNGFHQENGVPKGHQAHSCSFFAFAASPATKVSQQQQHREKRQLVTCPGYAGYCTESYPGDTCLVVCAFGRNNVPECQVCCRAESHDLTNKEYVE